MRLTNNERLRLMKVFKDIDKVGITHFLAEYLAENICTINQGDTSGTIQVRNKFILEFKEELISQVNERV